MRVGFVITVVCGSVVMFGIGVPRLRRPTLPAAPQLRLSEHIWDFGAVFEDGEQLTQRFRLTNTAGMPLSPRVVEQSCACIVSDLTSAPLQSGASLYFQVRLDLRGRRGQVHESVTIGGNAADSQAVKLSIVGSIKKRLEVVPAMLDFGDVAPGCHARRSLLLVPGDDDHAVTVTDVSCGDAALRWAVGTDAAGAQETTVNIDLIGRDDPGCLTTSLIVQTTHDKICRIEVPIRARFVGLYTLRPTSLFIGEPASSMPAGRSVTLRSNMGQPFSIAAQAEPGIELSAEPALGALAIEHTIRVRLLASEPGTHRWLVRISASTPNIGEILLPVTAVIPRQP